MYVPASRKLKPNRPELRFVPGSHLDTHVGQPPGLTTPTLTQPYVGVVSSAFLMIPTKSGAGNRNSYADGLNALD